MAKSRMGVEHVMVSTSTSIYPRPCIYYGCRVVNATTAGVQVKIFDAISTAQGTLVDVSSVTAGTNATAISAFSQGIIMHSGIFVSAIVATTASDNIIVYYGGI